MRSGNRAEHRCPRNEGKLKDIQIRQRCYKHHNLGGVHMHECERECVCVCELSVRYMMKIGTISICCTLFPGEKMDAYNQRL